MSQENDHRPPYERGWERRDTIALLKYKVDLARQRGGLCGEQASMVKLALQDGAKVSPPITLEELGITEAELDEIIHEGKEKTARRIALLMANAPKAGAAE